MRRKKSGILFVPKAICLINSWWWSGCRKFGQLVFYLCERMTQRTPEYMSHVTRDWPSFIHSFRQQAINIIPLREISKERICCLFHVNISFYAFIHRYFNFKVVVVVVNVCCTFTIICHVVSNSPTNTTTKKTQPKLKFIQSSSVKINMIFKVKFWPI